MNLVKADFLEASELLNEFVSDNNNFIQIQKAGDEIVKAVENQHKIISCGNGGSMSDAMHFAEELTGRFRNHRPSIPAIAISDASHITCAANDYGFDSIFSRFVEGFGQPGDVLLAISTSGNSANILKAAETARQKGMVIIGLTGKDGGKLAKLCNTEIRVPFFGYSDRIQEIHIKIIHTLIHYIEDKLFPNN
jgi:D-sedoheptulose 7-phosphate isomerase